jgi:prepilin-type N-terminal cleavage/methylation domain-containing protein
MMKVEGLLSRVECQKRVAALRAYSDPQPSTLNHQPRRGMTLIELLVVIIIITTIVAAAIPLLSPSNDSRRLREAARAVNTFIGGAQSRAIALRRPYGVAIKRVSFDTKKPDDRSVSIELFYVEQLPPYTGFDVNSRVSVALNPNPSAIIPGYLAPIPDAVLIRFITRGTTGVGLPVGWTTDLFPQYTIHPGDLIEINGTLYELLAPYDNINIHPETGTFEQQNQGRVCILWARPKNNSGQLINPRYYDDGREIGSFPPPRAGLPYWTDPSTYKVLRQPTSTSDEPYQMPEGTGIDLRASGVGHDNFFYVQDMNDNDEGILMMFTPEGRVQRVAYYQTPPVDELPFDGPVVDSIYLLVGRRDRTPPPFDTDPSLDRKAIEAAVTPEAMQRLREPLNWLNGSAYWVVVGAQSGRVATIEVANVNLPDVVPVGAPQNETTRNDQIYAAREFTREMAQMGGR